MELQSFFLFSLHFEGWNIFFPIYVTHVQAWFLYTEDVLKEKHWNVR